MGKNVRTETGGRNEAFQTTHWTELLAARTLTPERRREVVATIVGRYWKPVYAYLRRKGKDNEEAKDLTQGFFEKVVLGRRLIQQADQRKGKFRSFLLTALDHYVADAFAKERAKKRMPPGGLVRLDRTDFPDVPVSGHASTPAEAFTYAWACQMLDEVLAAVETGCRKDRLGQHWEVFRRTVVEPALSGAEPPSLSHLCAELAKWVCT